MTWSFWAPELDGREVDAFVIFAMFGTVGAVMTVVFLFVVIGQFVHRELEVRDLGNSDE